MPLVNISDLVSWIYPSLTWEKKPEENVVYLTFDDGPHPEITQWILDELNRYNYKATFFCIGENMLKYPEVVAKTSGLGHEIGNHSLNHLDGFRSKTDAYVENVRNWNTERQARLFRPPYGRIKKSQIKRLAKEYEIVMWTLLSWDFKGNLNQDKILAKLKKYTRPGAIIVFHDSVKAEKNLKAILPRYCSWLKENSYISKAL